MGYGRKTTFILMIGVSDLLNRWLSCLLELLIKLFLPLCSLCWFNEIKIEQRFKDIQVPLSFARLNINDRSGHLAFDFMGRKIADVSNGVKAICNMRR